MDKQSMYSMNGGVTCMSKNGTGQFSSPFMPGLWNYSPDRVGPMIINTTKSVLNSGVYTYPSIIYTNDLSSGTHILSQFLLSIVPGGVDSTVNLYLWPKANQGLTVGSVDVAQLYAIYTIALKVDTTSVASQTTNETIQCTCNLPIGAGDKILAVSNVANNNTITLSIHREV